MSPRHHHLLASLILVVVATLGATTHIAHANEGGEIDTGFMTNIGTGAQASQVSEVLELPDGKLLLGGNFTSFNGVVGRVVRLLADGRRDTTWRTVEPNSSISDMALDSKGRIVIAGNFTTIAYDGGAPVPAVRVARLNADGTQDTTFTADGPNQNAETIGILADDSIVIGGDFTMVGGTAAARIARLGTTGALDTTFNTNIGSGLNAAVFTVLVRPSGRIVVSGLMTTFNGSACPYIIALNSNGTRDTLFDVGTGPQFGPNLIAPYIDSRIVVQGFFTTFNGTTRNRIAIINDDGSLDTTFDPGVGCNNNGTALAVDTVGRILVGSGNMTSYQGTTINKLVRILPDGTLDPDYQLATTIPNGHVFGLTIQSNGRILASGGFTTFDGVSASRLVRLFSDEEVTSVESHADNGTYGADAVIPIRVTWTAAVDVAGGTPSLTLNSGGTATYSSGSGTTTLTFDYTVASGENATDLDATAIALNGATITAGSENASLILPAAGLPGSLSANNNLTITTTSSGGGGGTTTSGGCSAGLDDGVRLDLLAMWLLVLVAAAWRRRVA
ncbi:MAG: delta-60 repeat domain-containing protein [Planctomycetota bacterium]